MRHRAVVSVLSLTDDDFEVSSPPSPSAGSSNMAWNGG